MDDLRCDREIANVGGWAMASVRRSHVRSRHCVFRAHTS